MNKNDQPKESLQTQTEGNPPDVQDAGASVENTPKPAAFTFWRGLQTVLGAAFIVASLFTLWTPSSLVESG
ncbi:MAG: hypothetical protein SVP52_02915, partial [Chloroflexota bacterium]|nr:hypothetical protein [Chloroflexota bacterium]